MSRFFRSGDSSSSSEDEEEEEVAPDATKSDVNLSSSISAVNIADSPTTNHKDGVLHALLEEWCLNQTLRAHRGARPEEIRAEAKTRYLDLVSKLAPLNIISAGLEDDRHATTRQTYRNGLDALGTQHTGSPVGARHLLTDGSVDAAQELQSLPAGRTRQNGDRVGLDALGRQHIGTTVPPARHLLTGGNFDAAQPLQSLPVPHIYDLWESDPGARRSLGLVQHGAGSDSSSSHNQNNYEQLSVLGRGGYGIVYKAHNRLDDQTYAVKKVPLSAARLQRLNTRGEAEMDEILRELRTLARLHHPNIVRYFTAWVGWTGDMSNGARATDSLNETSLSSQNAHAGADDSRDRSLGRVVTGDDVDGAQDSRDYSLGRVFTEDDVDGTDIVFEHSNTTEDRTSTDGSATADHFSEMRQLRRTDTRSTIATASDETVETIEREPEVSASILSTAEGAQFAHSTLAIHIVMSLHPMTLADLLVSRGDDGDSLRHCYHLEPSVGITTAVLDGIEYLHDEGVIHRDIKPANIFLSPSRRRGPGKNCVDLSKCDDCERDESFTSAELDVCIGDFGLAAVASPETESHTASSPVGTAIYRPTTNEGTSASLDIYALGIVLFELLWKFDTRMERHDVICELKEGRYPDGFCESIGKGRGVSVMECIDCMLTQHSPATKTAEVRKKLSALVAPIT